MEVKPLVTHTTHMTHNTHSTFIKWSSRIRRSNVLCFHSNGCSLLCSKPQFLWSMGSSLHQNTLQYFCCGFHSMMQGSVLINIEFLKTWQFTVCLNESEPLSGSRWVSPVADTRCWCWWSLVPQIDPSVPQPVVQSRRRPLHLRHY